MPTDDKSRERREQEQKTAQHKPKLDRSTEGVIETGRARQKPAPADAPPDRHTTDSRRGG